MAFPRYDSSLPWKEKKKILEAEIKAKSAPLIKVYRDAKKKKAVKRKPKENNEG